MAQFFFSNAERKLLTIQNPTHPVKMPSKNKGEIKKLSNEGTLREFVDEIYLKRKAKGSPENKKDMVKEGFLEHQKERTMKRSKIRVIQ